MLPSMNFMRRIQEDRPQYYTQEISSTQYSKPKKAIVKELIEVTQEEKVPVKQVETKQIFIKNIQSIEIKRNNTQEDIQHVIKRFKKSNNPALSLFAAKKYYEIGNYNQAYNYALITNEINNNIEESWIIFSKSLVKLNRKDKAIELLTKYVNYSQSYKGNLLLSKIKSGEFR